MTQYNDFNAEKRAHYNKLAAELLSKKGWPRYYAVGYYSEDFGDEVWDFNVPLTEEQYNQMKTIVEECKAEDIDLSDYFYDNEAPEYIQLNELGFDRNPRTIDLDDVHYPCNIKMAIFYDGLDKVPQITDRVIVLSHAEYQELLEWQLLSRSASYNDLHNDRPQLYKAVDEKIRMVFEGDDIGIMPMTVPIFAVELTSIKAEAIQLCGEDGLRRQIFCSSSEEAVECSSVDIEDCKMNLFYQRFDIAKQMVTDTMLLDNIDAIAVEKALGVSSYAGIADYLVEHYDTSDGVARFAEFLRSKSIAFVEKDKH